MALDGLLLDDGALDDRTSARPIVERAVVEEQAIESHV